MIAQEVPTTGPVRRRRPFGVGVIAVLMFVNALAAAATLYFNYEPSLREIQSVGYVEAASLAISLLGSAVAIGLWFLKRWAWVAVITVLGIDMALDLYGYFYATPSYISMTLSVIAVFYMNQREVRQAFGYVPLGKRPGFE